MKKIILLEKTYSIEPSAYIMLTEYLDAIKGSFLNESEVVTDISYAIIDILDEQVQARALNTVTTDDVTQVITRLGTIDQISDMQDREESEPMVVRKKLYRDKKSGWLGGVASGLASYFGFPVWIVRLLFLLGVFTPLPVVIVYVLMWFIVPPARNRADQLHMQGIPVTLSSLSNTDGYVKKRVFSLAWLIGIVMVLFSMMVAAISGLIAITLLFVGIQITEDLEEVDFDTLKEVSIDMSESGLQVTAPDAALRAQGVLTDRACGFDSDMVGTLIIFILLVAALGFFLVSLREK